MEPFIKLDRIYKSFEVNDEHLNVLNGVCLSIYRGEFISLVGASGSGKSTLLNVIGCLEPPTLGTYYFESNEISGMNDAKRSWIRRYQLGFVFQQFNLIPYFSVLENVMLPLFYQGIKKDDQIDRSIQQLKLVGLEKRYNHRPSQLSGGERQRVAISRALVTNPALILADEPTGNLDSSTSATIMDAFHSIHKSGQTILLITHDHSIANQTDRILRINDGQIMVDDQ